ncbi:MAG: hypothetical protein RL329_4124 [Bacteroidota bacterium]
MKNSNFVKKTLCESWAFCFHAHSSKLKIRVRNVGLKLSHNIIYEVQNELAASCNLPQVFYD